MQVESLALTLAEDEIRSLVRSVALPKGAKITDVALLEGGVELTVRAPFLLGIPLKFRVHIRSYAGSRVSLQVTPPVKPNWPVVRLLVRAVPGASYAGHSVIEVDLVALSRGHLSGITIEKLALGKSGLIFRAKKARSPHQWADLLSSFLP